MDRPAFAEMLEYVLGNGCRTIIVESLDRFARDLTVQMQLIALLVTKGITLIADKNRQALDRNFGQEDLE